MGKWTRRGFITAGAIGTGALVIGVAIRPGHRAPGMAKYVANEGESLVNAWVKIDDKNKVTAIIPHSEMGQGAQTALSQMLADELDAKWEDVSFIEAPAEDEYANYAMGKGYILGDASIPKLLVGSVDGLFLQVAKAMHLQVTGGSASIRTTGVYGMRVAGAAAREVLLEAAAEAWEVDVATLTTSEGMIIDSTNNKTEPYSTFIVEAATKAPSATPTLKTPEQFTIMGHSKPRLDIPAKVDGSAQFGIDVEVEGMKIATVAGAPVFGAQVSEFDASKAKTMSGVVDVVNLGDAIAVVADSYWQAKKALAAVTIEWTSSEFDKYSSNSIFSQFSDDMAATRSDGSSNTDIKVGDASAIISSAKNVIKRSYTVPYLAHACMEPMNAVADVKNGQCELWTGTQDPLGFKYKIAEALSIESDQVTVNNQLLGGGFGRRNVADTAIQAARISQSIGKPVKLIWSREEDMQHDHYRPAIASDFYAVLDDNGNPTAWENQFVDKHEPAEAPHIPYDIANQFIHYTDSKTHVPFGAWRSVDHSQHGFFTESFIDEVAFEAKQDPYAYRRNLLENHPRHRNVLDLAAEKSGWSKQLGEGKGRGISLQECFGSIVAQVVEVTVTKGQVSVDKVTLAIDAGFAVSPDGLTAQMESGVIYGLTAALYGNIEIEQGQVKQTNFVDYPMVRMKHAPVIDTHIINSHESWGGAGEPGTPGTAPALANAIFSATGIRIRSLPLDKYELNLGDSKTGLQFG